MMRKYSDQEIENLANEGIGFEQVDIFEEIENLRSIGTEVNDEFCRSGIAINMHHYSDYINYCYYKAEDFIICINRKEIEYNYFVDINNGAFVLFNDYYDWRNSEFSVVDIYWGREEFEQSALGQELQKDLDPTTKVWYDSNKAFYCDNDWYNDLNIIKDLQKLQSSVFLRRKHFIETL